MRKSPLLCALALLAAVKVAASPGGDHLVTQAMVQGVLSEAAGARDRDLSTLRGLLSTPMALETANRLGVSQARLAREVAKLHDAEIHDLAHRAATLSQDPVAGQAYGPDLSGLGAVVVAAGVVVVLIIALAVYAIVKIAE
jgi:hypothetical protein